MEQMLCGVKWEAELIYMQLYGLKILNQLASIRKALLELMLSDIDTVLISVQFTTLIKMQDDL